MNNIEENKKEMLKKKNWAVIGVTADTDKFGHKIFQKLKEKGYEVYGVNPKYSELNGEKIYNNINDLPHKPDCISMVVNPKISLKTLNEIKESGIQYVWFQPGTFNDEVIEQCSKYGVHMVYNDCILIALGD